MAADKIGGEGKIVQVDEAVLGCRKHRVGRVYDHQCVCGMVDEDGLVRMELCRDGRTKEALHAIIRRNVRSGSKIHSDGWTAYRGLDRIGYAHQVVNHRREFVSPEGTHTQRIESQWRAMRREFSHGGRRHEDLADNIVEYLWRRGCHQRNLDPFAYLVPILKY